MKKYFIYSLLLQFLFGCGDGSTVTSENTIAREELKLVAMEGTWEGCRENGSNSFFVSLVATGQSVSTTIDFYNGVTDCSTTPSFRTQKSGAYTIGTESQAVTGYDGQQTNAFNLDISISQFIMTANTAGVIAGWNAFSVCGKSDWLTATPISVLDLTNCDPSLGTNHPDEVTNGLVTNLVSSPNSSTLLINVQVSSNGSVTTRPSELSSNGPYNVSLTKQ